ncbi:diacylglycerol/lipid kinase family protein [Agrococcus jejuensis]|uniref:Diacylglycerol kinase n=1 Tax=Agrococcus jejuensis TaxID=399736 RepID=A0A1G8FZG9_9MICO|nr:diacylglycerol kinase family protein [Agrococcus jejuensis]SDH87531.1 diacylglycerol kinase [Agrococcus jejuensis]
MLVVVASNPQARFGRSGPVGERVVQALRAAGHEVVHRTAPDFAALQRAARAAAQRADALVVVGGDGMVHLGVNAVGGSSTPLAIVPAGSGNDFATEIGMPGVEEAIAGLPALLETEPARCDLIRIRHPDGEAFAAGIVSVGFDADVNVRSFRMTRVPARLRYQAAILATLASLTHRTFRIRIDGGEERTWRTVIAAIANHRVFGGGIPIAPTASTVDGRLTGILADELSRPQFLALLAKALKGRHLADPRVHVEDIGTVTIASDDATVLACADGEIVGRLPIECSVAVGALRVFGTPR